MSWREDLEAAWQKYKFKPGKRRMFYVQAHLLLDNDVMLIDIFSELYKVYSNGGKNPKNIMARVAEDCVAGLKSGRSLSETIYPWVSYEEFATIEAGELTGQLGEGIKRAIDSIDVHNRMMAVIMKVTVYPSFLLLMMSMTLWRIAKDVVPKISKMSKPETWTFSAKLLKWLSDAVVAFGIPGLFLLFVLLMCVIYSLPNLSDGPRRWLDRIPPWSIYRMVKGSTFLLNVGMLQGAGAKLTEALERQGRYASKWLKRRVDAALYGVKIGADLGEALFRSGYEFPDRDAISFLRVVSSRSRGEEVIEKFGKDWLDESVRRLEAMGKVLMSACIVGIGLLIALVFIGSNGMGNSMLNALQR